MAVKKTAKKSTTSNKSNEGDNTLLCAILSYLIVGIIWYFVDEKMKKNSFVRRHARQGLTLLLLAIVVSIVGMVLGFIPFLGAAISIVLNIALFVLWIVGIVHAVQKKDEPMPVIGELAEKMSF